MKKITKALLIGIGAAIGIGASVGITKAANRSEVDDRYFDDEFDDDLFDDYDGDVEDTEEE